VVESKVRDVIRELERDGTEERLPTQVLRQQLRPRAVRQHGVVPSLSPPLPVDLVERRQVKPDVREYLAEDRTWHRISPEVQQDHQADFAVAALRCAEEHPVVALAPMRLLYEAEPLQAGCNIGRAVLRWLCQSDGLL